MYICVLIWRAREIYSVTATRDAPLRMSAGEASVVQPKIALQSNTKIDQVLAEKAWLQKISMPYTMDGHWKF